METHTWTGGYIFIDNLKQSARYEPVQSGRIETIDFSFDAAMFDNTGGEVRFELLASERASANA